MRAGYTRVGKHGGAAGRWADAHEWTVASFFQHDSRDHDPQLHIHNTVLNKVQGPDGVWRTIDGRSLYRWRPAAASVAERTTAERLTHALGLLLATRPDGKAREVLGVAQEAMDLISTRCHALTAKAAELTAGFETRYGRAPNGLERERLTQQATLLTRRSKSHTGETREQVLDRVHEKLRADITGGLHGVAQAALAARGAEPPEPMRWSPEQVIATALAEVQAGRAGWTHADLAAAIDRALPDYLGVTDGHDIGRLLDQLTEQALGSVTCLDTARPGDAQLPDALRLDNGDSAYQAPGSQLYATPEHVHTERILAAATSAGDAAALPHPVAARFLAGLAEAGIELGPDQAAAVRGVLTSGARVETLIGPAGTGKSFVVGTIARAWTHPTALSAATPDTIATTPDTSTASGPDGPGRVFGLATSQIATEVLKGEGLTASNVAAWLGAQRRLTNATGVGPRATAADEAWRLRPGDLVVVDESAMTDTTALAAIHQHADAVGAKLLLVGDHRQLATIGAGGGMDLVAASGARYELAEARRFTHPWEREASLRLRAGDEAVLRTYHQQGRLLDAGTTEQAEQSAATAWLGDTLSGQRSMLLVDTNEQAARLSASLRAELVRLGQVQERGVTLGLQGTVAGVGDVVEARRLDWTLAGIEGNPRGVINRERFRVTAVRDDGALEVAPLRRTDGDPDLPMVLPAAYVAEHLALGYASTVHAAQGATVDTTHTVVTQRTGPAALYVGMSRGREANTAHVATLTAVEDPAQGSTAQTLHRDPVAVLSRVLDATDAVDAANRSAVATADLSAVEAGSARTAAELLADAAQIAATERTTTWLDQLTGAGALTGDQRVRVAAQDGAATLTRILRRVELAGHDPHQALIEAVTASDLDGARNLANVLYARIRGRHADRLDPVGDTFGDWTPATDNPQWHAYLTALAAQVDQRAADLGRHAVAAGDQAPGWAVEAFGPVPTSEDARAQWARHVGQVAAYREVRGHDDDRADDRADDGRTPGGRAGGGGGDALGAAPGSGQVEQYAAYRAAWRTLGRPEAARDLAELTDGQLWIRVVAADREDKWGPRYVANELAGTRQAADTQRRTAALRDAEADTTTDPDRQGQLRDQAGQGRALAATLDQQAAQLQFVDDARARHLLHTAHTRVEGAEARAELARRHQDDPAPPERITADEWFTAHQDAAAEDDQHRHITPDDLDQHAGHATENVTADAVDGASDDAADRADPREVLHTPEPDIREVAADEPAQVDEDHLRRPSANEIAVSVGGAHRTITELDVRAAYDRQHEVEERAAELARWHHDDQHTGDVFDGHDDGPARTDPDDALVYQS